MRGKHQLTFSEHTSGICSHNYSRICQRFWSTEAHKKALAVVLWQTLAAR